MSFENLPVCLLHFTPFPLGDDISPEKQAAVRVLVKQQFGDKYSDAGMGPCKGPEGKAYLPFLGKKTARDIEALDRELAKMDADATAAEATYNQAKRDARVLKREPITAAQIWSEGFYAFLRSTLEFGLATEVGWQMILKLLRWGGEKSFAAKLLYRGAWWELAGKCPAGDRMSQGNGPGDGLLRILLWNPRRVWVMGLFIIGFLLPRFMDRQSPKEKGNQKDIVIADAAKEKAALQVLTEQEDKEMDSQLAKWEAMTPEQAQQEFLSKMQQLRERYSSMRVATRETRKLNNQDAVTQARVEEAQKQEMEDQAALASFQGKGSLFGFIAGTHLMGMFLSAIGHYVLKLKNPNEHFMQSIKERAKNDFNRTNPKYQIDPDGQCRARPVATPSPAPAEEPVRARPADRKLERRSDPQIDWVLVGLGAATAILLLIPFDGPFGEAATGTAFLARGGAQILARYGIQLAPAAIAAGNLTGR